MLIRLPENTGNSHEAAKSDAYVQRASLQARSFDRLIQSLCQVCMVGLSQITCRRLLFGGCSKLENRRQCRPAWAAANRPPRLSLKQADSMMIEPCATRSCSPNCSRMRTASRRNHAGARWLAIFARGEFRHEFHLPEIVHCAHWHSWSRM
jgi:hypothetical protein